MQFFNNLLRVIFMLSTIVAVTDCCSSRILLLRERTLKIVRQQKIHGHAHHQQQQLQLPTQEKIPQHIDIPTDFNKNYSSEHILHIFSAEESSNETTEDDTAETDPPPFTTPTVDVEEVTANAAATPDDALAASTDDDDTTESSIDDGNKVQTEAIVEDTPTPAAPPLRERNAGNPKYHVIDFYYTLMRDVLSLECSGQYLTDFCLNGGRCFRFPVGNHSFFSCECADGYVGERCESKSFNGHYTSTPTLGAGRRPLKILTARIIFTFPMLLAISAIYILYGAIIVFKCQRQQKEQRFAAAAAMFAG